MRQAKPVGLETVIARSDEVICSQVDGEVVMMSVEQGKYSGLNIIGSDIWRLLETPMPVSEICKAMMTIYQVDEEQCERDVLTFLNDLATDATIRIVDRKGS